MKNNLKKILEKRGFRKVLLTEDCLIKSGMKTMHRFNKILDNEVDLTATEMNGISEFFCIPVTDLVEFGPNTKRLANAQAGK